MGSHPANLTLRFLLELTALIAVGRWGFQQTSSWPRYALMIVLPLALAILWGVFAVPNDPSRSGNAPVPIPGGARLLLELLVFAAGSCALYTASARVASFTFTVIVIVHYALSYDRISWLLSRSP